MTIPLLHQWEHLTLENPSRFNSYDSHLGGIIIDLSEVQIIQKVLFFAKLEVKFHQESFVNVLGFKKAHDNLERGRDRALTERLGVTVFENALLIVQGR